MTKAEDKLVRGIVMYDRVPGDAVSCERDLRSLARIAAEGRFSGDAIYFIWGVSSSMGEALHRFIRAAESVSGKGFLRLVVEAQEQTCVPWTKIVDRPWVPLSVGDIDAQYVPPETFLLAEREIAEKKHALSHPRSPRPQLPYDIPFDERWSRYVDALVRHGERADWFFPTRFDSEQREWFVLRFCGSSREIRSLVIADISNHRRPHWRRILKRLLQEDSQNSDGQ